MANATQSTADFKGDHLSVKMFGARGDGVTDDYAAIMAGHAAAVASGSGLFFPVGIYAHATPIAIAPLFADATTHWTGASGARLKYTGASTTVQFTFDGSATVLGKSAVIRDLIFDGNNLVSDGVLFRLLHGGEVSNIRVANASRDAIILEGCVTCMFNTPTVTGDVEPPLVLPVRGLVFRTISAGAFAGNWSGNVTINNIRMEHVSGAGIDISGAQGVVLNGGTSEANGTGLKIGAGTFGHMVSGMDMEGNSVTDIDDGGLHNTFTGNHIVGQGSSPAVILRATAKFERFIGANNIWDVEVEAGALSNSFTSTLFEKPGGPGAQITDLGSNTAFLDCIDGYFYNFIPNSIYGDLNITAVTTPLVVTHFPAANNVTALTASWRTGADGTLGPLLLNIFSRPSATANSRYVAIEVGDSLDSRTLALQSGGASGNLVVGTRIDDHANKLQVTGTTLLAGNLKVEPPSGSTQLFLQQVSAALINTITYLPPGAVTNANPVWYAGVMDSLPGKYIVRRFGSGTIDILVIDSVTALVSLAGGLNVGSPGNAAGDALTTNAAQTLTNKDLTSGSNTFPAPALPNVGTAGTYTKVTTDAQGRVSAGAVLAATDMPRHVEVSLTGQSAGIGTTNLQPGGAMAPAGLYLINVYMFITTVGTSGNLVITITWADGTATRTSTPFVNVNSTATALSTSLAIRTAGAAHISYSTSLAGVVGSPVYSLYIEMHQLI